MIQARYSLIQEQMEMSQYIGKRKHSSQLQDFEIEGLTKRLKEVQNWNIRTHALVRLEEKGINATYQDLTSCIHDATIIEYKIDYNNRYNRCDERVVIRANSVVNYFYNLNVVYSLTEKRIVTVWINNINDKHDTLNWDIYSDDMKVFGI